jgi:hypothetical protein
MPLSDDQFLGGTSDDQNQDFSGGSPPSLSDDQFLNPAPALTAAPPSRWSGTNAALGRGATFDLSDLAGAAGTATGAWLKRELPLPGTTPAPPGGTWQGDFQSSLAGEREDAASFKAAYPYSNLAATLVGLPRAIAAPVAGAAVPSLAQAMKTGATGGAIAGGATAAAGAADPLSTEGVWDELRGELTGAALGAVLPPVASMIGTMAAPVLRPLGQVLGPLFDKGQKLIAGRIFNQVAAPGGTTGDDVAALAALSKPAGVNPTLGDLMGNNGLAAFQKSVQQGNPVVAAQAAAIASDNNQKILDAFDQIGQPGTRNPYEISQQAAQRLEATRASQQKAASDAFKAVPTSQVQLPVAPYLQRYGDYVDSLPAADADLVPDTYKNLLDTISDKYGDQTSLQEMQSLRSRAQGDASAAYNAQDYNKARVLRGVTDALGNPEDDLAPAEGPIGDALRAARAQWSDYASTYTNRNTAPTINAILREGGTPDSAALQKLLGSGQGGQAERVQEFLNAAQGDPETLQLGRDWFASQMRAVGSKGPSLDDTGAQFLNGNQLRLFRNDNAPLIDSDLLDAGHRQAIDDIVNASNMVQRVNRAGAGLGSPTYTNLANNRYLSGLGMSPLAATLAQGVPHALAAGAGGLVTHMLGGGLSETGLGAMFGDRLASSFGFNYPAAADKVTRLVQQGFFSPNFAAELMQRAAATPAPTTTGFLRALAPAVIGAAPNTPAGPPAFSLPGQY